MRKKLIFSFVCAILVLNWACLVRAEDNAEVSDSESRDLVVQVENWLALVDKGQYEESWTEAGAYLKLMVKKDQWESQIAAVRSLVGELISRSLKDKRYLNTLSGAPDGEYCVLFFDTVFSNKAAAVETVTVAKDEEGRWRLVGYFIK